MLFKEEDTISLDELTENIDVENNNAYISDSGKAIELLAKLICSNKNKSRINLQEIKKVIEQIYRLMNDCNVPGIFEQQRNLEIFLERLTEWGTAGILRGKYVVSLGGRFSAGKSLFINSITGIDDFLPVDQNPTTSISSYIVKSEYDEIEANTKFGYSCKLDKEEMKALSHEFYNEYSIGFSSVLENIIIRSKRFDIDESIVLLDTPGYSKADADNNVRERTSDKQKAHEKLAITDYLIWLVDITKGTITSEDLDFIRGLYLTNDILFVFTKADKRNQEAVEEVVNLAKETLSNAGFSYYAVTAYSSVEKKEYCGEYITEFFNEVVKNKKSENDIVEQIWNIEKNIREIIGNEKKVARKRIAKYFEVLSEAKNITSVASVAELWKYEKLRLRRLSKAERMFKEVVERLNQIIEKC